MSYINDRIVTLEDCINNKPLLSRIKWVFLNAYWGIVRDKFPICCVIEYIID